MRGEELPAVVEGDPPGDNHQRAARVEGRPSCVQALRQVLSLLAEVLTASGRRAARATRSFQKSIEMVSKKKEGVGVLLCLYLNVLFTYVVLILRCLDSFSTGSSSIRESESWSRTMSAVPCPGVDFCFAAYSRSAIVGSIFEEGTPDNRRLPPKYLRGLRYGFLQQALGLRGSIYPPLSSRSIARCLVVMVPRPRLLFLFDIIGLPVVRVNSTIRSLSFILEVLLLVGLRSLFQSPTGWTVRSRSSGSRNSKYRTRTGGGGSSAIRHRSCSASARTRWRWGAPPRRCANLSESRDRSERKTQPVRRLAGGLGNYDCD